MLPQLIRDQKLLISAGMLFLVVTAVFGVMAMTDSVQILGVNRWIKPMKFGMSIAVYLITLAIYLYFVPGRPRAKTVIAWGAAFLMTGEVALITMQAARGTTSHFNNLTAFDDMVFSAMGLMIVANTILLVYLLVIYFRDRIDLPTSIVWGLRLGLIAILLSAVEGGYMSVVMAHSVGVADGGPGIPIFNWSTVAGDLRVAHFIGMHGLQAIPFFALIAEKFAPAMAKLPSVVFGVLYIGIFAALFVQAMMGKPLLALS